MQLIKAIAALFILSGFCCAQTSTINATITDTDGQTWNNGSFAIHLYVPGGIPTTCNNVPMTSAQQNFSGNLNGSGVLNQAVCDTSFISPSGTQWQFTICPNASAQCSTGSTAVVGATPSLNAVLSGFTIAPRFTAGSNSFGYLDIEVKPIPLPGGVYYNVTNSVQRIWNGATWSNSGGSGGGATFPSTAGVVCNTSTTVSQNCTSNQVQTVIGSGVYAAFGSVGGTPVIKYISQSCPGTQVNLNTGLAFSGGSATNQSTCINALLAAATTQVPVYLVVDGSFLVSGIFGPAAGNWGLIGLGGGLTSADVLYGSGFYQATGTNDDVIHNGIAGAGCVVGTGGSLYSDPGWGTPGTAPARGANLIFKDFIINGNRGNGTTGNSTSGIPQGIGTFSGLYTPAYCWYMGINAMNVNNVIVDGVTFYNTSSYNLRLMNAGQVKVINSTFANVGYTGTVSPQNGDGVHISAPANNISISNNFFRTTDDAIAVNAPEGWVGPINGVVIANNTCLQCQTMLRAYTGSIAPPTGDALPTVNNVNITNYSGNPNVAGLLLGLELSRTLTATNTVTNFDWSNSTISSPIFALINDNLGNIGFHGMTWASPGGFGMINSSTVASNVSLLALDGVTIHRTTSGSGATSFIDTASAGIGGTGNTQYTRIDINGARVVDDPGTSFSALAQAINITNPSTISNLNANGIDFSNIALVIRNGGTARVTGNQGQMGVMHAVATLTTGTSDTISIPGTSNSSFCWFGAANAIGAAAMGNAFYSAASAPTITITHTVTIDSGGVLAVMCTPN